ncbi:MAG: helix-turn-helix domain-containing protein [Actinomycetota bacterium]
MDIADVAEKSGLPASTLRYYEGKGLIRSTGRHGLRRQFDDDVIDRLALVGLGRQAGFSLDEIADMFSDDGRPRIDRQQLLGKADEIDATIDRLAAMRDNLRHVAACPATDHMACPNFRRLLRAATRRDTVGAAGSAARPG